MYTQRLTNISYEDVYAEMARHDYKFAKYIQKHMPGTDKVKLVLSDSGTVRYFVYTEHDIYIVDVNEYMTLNGEEHADWGLVKIPINYDEEYKNE